MKKNYFFPTILITLFTIPVIINGQVPDFKLTLKTGNQAVYSPLMPSALLYGQLSSPSNEAGIASQDFPDYPDYSCQAADDFIVPAGELWSIDEIFCTGGYTAGGGMAQLSHLYIYYNDPVLNIPAAPVVTYPDHIVTSTAGGNLTFILTTDPIILTAGHYWISIQPDMSGDLYGQWFWHKQESPTIINQYHWRNPGGGFGITGSQNWLPGFAVTGGSDHNLTFGLYGTVCAPLLIVGSVSANQTICSGATPVLLTGVPPSNGTSPVYQWQSSTDGIIFTNIPGATNLNFQPGALTQTTYYRQMQNSTGTCNGPLPTNTLTIIVNPLLPVSITIAASANPVCAGTLVTFSATAINGGSMPVYQWWVNGTICGTSNSTYSYTPSDGDEILCKLTSNASCVTGNPAFSNSDTLIVKQNLAVGVSVAASANPVCTGTPVTFTAIPVNGGMTPEYQWFVNGTTIPGATSSTYYFTPVNGDVISCQMLSDVLCATGNPAASNALTMTVNPYTVPGISGPASVCVNSAGNVYTTQAGMTNYEWNVSAGGTITGGGGIYPVLMTESFENGGSVPPGWATQVVSGENTVSFDTITHWPSGYNACNGTYLVRFNSFSVNGGIVRLKKTTPVSTIGYTSINVDFAWLESSGYAGAPDKVEVQWSTNGTTWTTAGTFNRYNAVQGWKTRSQALPAAAQGQATLYIAFLFTSAYGNDCYLDFSHITTGGIPPPSTITSGTGTATCVYPYTTFWGAGRTQLLYTADQLLAAGASPGSISSIGFNVYAADSGIMNQFNLKLGNTSSSTLYGWVTSGMEICYTGTYTVPGTGWQMITLQSPFMYDGTNLIVEICYTNPGYSNYSLVTGTTASAGQIRTYWMDGLNGCSYTGANYTGFADLPDLRFVEQPIGGAALNAITVTWNTPGTGTVSVNYTNASGCRAAVPTVFNVTVNPLPVPAITGEETACVNSTGNAYATQTGMNNYVWTVSQGGTVTAGNGTNAIEVTWNTSGQKTVGVSCTGMNGCDAPASGAFSVTVNSLPMMIQALSDITIADGRALCYDATQSVTVGGTGPFLVQPGGSVNLIAGENIGMLPGTVVSTGGYLHGFISASCIGCNANPMNQLVAVQPDSAGKEPLNIPALPKTHDNFFRAYPNPTYGAFILEISEATEITAVKVEIYGMCGEKLLDKRFTGSGQHLLSLEGKPSGIYFIRVFCGENMGSFKIIKQ
jgi:hypothetical protein